MKKQERLENKIRKNKALFSLMESNKADKVKRKIDSSAEDEPAVKMHKSETEKLKRKLDATTEDEPVGKKQTTETDNKTTKNRKSKNAGEGSEIQTSISNVNVELPTPEVKEIPKVSQLKQEIKEMRQKISAHNSYKNVPSFRLKNFGEKALLSRRHDSRQPLMLDDIQHLLMSALLGSSSPYKPHRWCVLDKPNKVSHTVILVIEGLTSYTFSANESLFVETKSIFKDQFEVILPKCEKNRIIEELSCVPLTQSQKEKLVQKYGSLEAAMNLNKEHDLILKSVFPIDGDAEEDFELPDGETFPRTRLLLSPLQMMIEGYPMPLKGEFEGIYKDFKYSRDRYTSVSSKSPMFGLDCEMVRTQKAANELARVSIVDENYQSVYETYVKPSGKIVDYLTRFSGITKETMENEELKTLEEVQEDVLNLLPADAILVGQSLNCDLNAMKLMHPYVIDTSCIFNQTGDRNRKSKLQHFVKEHLGEDIQKDAGGHSSIEDSTYSLKLTKLKLSKDIYFGDKALQDKRNIEDNQTYTGIAKNTDIPKPEPVISTTILSNAMKKRKKSAIVTTHRSDLEIGKFYSKNKFSNFSKNQKNDSKNQKNGSKNSKTSNNDSKNLKNSKNANNDSKNFDNSEDSDTSKNSETDFLNSENFKNSKNLKNAGNVKNDNTDDEKFTEDHGIAHHKEPTAKDVIKKTQEILLSNDFNLSHFNVFEDFNPDKPLSIENIEENIKESIPKIDKWIKKLWNSVATNGLFVVIFGGHEKNANGLSMINIKH